MTNMTTDTTMTDTSGKLELKLQEWNQVVSDETQCMRLSHEDEIKLLSSRNANLAEYLELHPEMAHELMVPSGFTQCLIRRYERFLGGQAMLSTQNGAAEKHRWNEETFGALLPGNPAVVFNPSHIDEPNWRELNNFVCRNAVDQVGGEKMAPHYEYKETGERVRVISYRGMKVEVTAKQWHLMWEHVVCDFADASTAEDVEFRALHEALNHIASIPATYHEWHFPSGQQIAIIQKQLEHRLRGAHVGRPNPCGACCPYRPLSAKTSLPPNFRVYLSKAEATDIVCKERLTNKEKTDACNYDPCVRASLEAQGVVIDETLFCAH